MNRYATIMQGAGWLAAGLWVAVWVHGFSAGRDPQALSWHTVLALAAASLTLLPRCWTLSFLILSRQESRPRARMAIGWAVFSLASLAIAFLYAGRLLWHRIQPGTHAAIGLAVVLIHLASLVFERRALRDGEAIQPVDAAS